MEETSLVWPAELLVLWKRAVKLSGAKLKEEPKRLPRWTPVFKTKALPRKRPKGRR